MTCHRESSTRMKSYGLVEFIQVPSKLSCAAYYVAASESDWVWRYKLTEAANGATARATVQRGR